MAEPHLSTGAYALDALEGIERAAAERHAASCPDCAVEIAEFREVAARLAERVAVPPPPELRQRVLSAARETRQVAPPARRPWRRVPLVRPLAAAAAAVAIAAGGLAGGALWQDQRQEERARITATQIASVLSDPARVQREGQPSVGGSATVVSAEGRAVFAASGLPAPPSGRAYQLWIIEGQAIRSAGVLTWEDGDTQTWVGDVAPGASIAVSVEPEDGSDQPTTDPVVSVAVA